MEILEALKVWALWLWSQWQTQVLTYHILINVVLAVAASIYTKEFLLDKVPEFLYRKILPFVMVYGVFAFAGEAIGQAGVAGLAWALLEGKLLADSLDNLKKFGLDFIPRSVTTEQQDEAVAYRAGETPGGERAARRAEW
jgi:hypothetical protein